MAFEQAAIKIQKEAEFIVLRDAVQRSFAPGAVQRLLERLQKKGIRIRDFDVVLASGVLEDQDETLAKSGKPARQWYQELTLSDQAQLREFYLSRVEEVAPDLRARFIKLYAYY